MKYAHNHSNHTDLGVTYDNKKLKFGLHIDKIYSKAALRAKLILKCFQTRSSSVLLKAYCTFVRPLLEYASVIWNPYHKGDINKIESVQRYFTKRLSGLFELISQNVQSKACCSQS